MDDALKAQIGRIERKLDVLLAALAADDDEGEDETPLVDMDGFTHGAPRNEDDEL